MRGNLALVVALLVCGVAGLSATAVAESDVPRTPSVTDSEDSNWNESAPGARIQELYPNPPTEGDAGEFVTITFPPGADIGAYTLTDGHSTVSLKPVTDAMPGPDKAGGAEDSLTAGRTWVPGAPLGLEREWTTLSFSTAPELTREFTDRRVVAMPGHIQLANDGDTVRLEKGGSVVDTVTYDRATAGEVYDAVGEGWTPLEATDRPVVAAEGGTVEAFVLPDSPEQALKFVEEAENRVLLAGYTLSSARVVDALVAAHDRGVTVEVLVDGTPVGGMEAPAAAALDRLSRAGVSVKVVGGDRDRYRFHHAKYVVVDDRALVTSENWKPSGTGGQSSRGWGVVTNQPTVVDGLVETFEADTGWVDAIAWEQFDDVTLTDGGEASGSYPAAFDPATLSVDRVDLLVAPDNAEREVMALLEGAEERIDIKQVHISDRGFPFLRAVVDAARRGVEVRILLSGAWYVEDENEELATVLRDRAEREDLPLSVRVAEPDGAFEKIHTKGVIVDGERTLVGSINWNNNSVRHNREVALLIHSEETAAYFGTVFDADWEGDRQEIPLGLVLVGLSGTVAAILAARTLEWG